MHKTQQDKCATWIEIELRTLQPVSAQRFNANVILSARSLHKDKR